MENLVRISLTFVGILIVIGVVQWLKGIQKKKRLSSSGNTDVSDDFSMANSVDFSSLEHELETFDVSDSPFSTSLFPSDMHLLSLHGYAPVQIVIGNVCYSMGFRGVTNSVMRAMKQGEMPAVTRMLNDGRMIARNRMNQQAKAIGADGVIGVTFQNNDILDFTEVTAIGTAIKKIGEDRSTQQQPALDVAVN